MTVNIKEFIKEHQNDDVNVLLLKAKQYADIDMHFVVNQIIARRLIKDKLPTWYANEDIVYPSRISTEQCSSELSAYYKQKLIKGESICDLTGGLGVDTYFFAQKVKRVIYMERFDDYCKVAVSNFQKLGAYNIEVINGDCRELLHSIDVDTFYIDPARRSSNNKRVFALYDCEPNILEIKATLLESAQRLIIKTSPMIDIEESARNILELCELHIVAVKNECKELLFVLEKGEHSSIKIHTCNIVNTELSQNYSYIYHKEKECSANFTKDEELGVYLYEPNTAILKAGAFKILTQDFEIHKLHQHSHLYTSNNLVYEFPGRIFKIEKIYEFSGKQIKTLGKLIPKANITVRNFNLSVDELRKKSGIKDGGDIYLFATTLCNNSKVIIQCKTAIR